MSKLKVQKKKHKKKNAIVIDVENASQFFNYDDAGLTMVLSPKTAKELLKQLESALK